MAASPRANTSIDEGDVGELPPTSADGRTGIDAVVRELLQSTFGLKPDDLGSCLAALTEKHLDVRDVVLYLVDLDQVELRPLGSPRGTDVQAVDSTPAGLAFRD